ncbi:hypothetical protein [Streptomyces luteireticuli]|uniref:Uncharacterized protein n=1 Tax=Streptomyces luteireticuli TaxID=173858 RepID=A0ABN0YUW4_9ACTN
MAASSLCNVDRGLTPALLSGRLVEVLIPAVAVAESAGDNAAALLELRRLIDAVAPAP